CLGFGQLLDAWQVVARHLRQLDDVLARVAAFGRLLAVQPRVDRRAEATGLRVVGVHVVLALDVVASELEHPADRVAQDRSAAVSDVQRTGRVDARELDLETLALPRVRGAGAGLGPRA